MSEQWAGGKGSARRPMAVDKEKYEDNWDRIFRKKDAKETIKEVQDKHPIRGKKD